SAEDTPNQILIVGVEDNTVIEVVPSAITLIGNSDPFSITLNRGEVYQIASLIEGTDLTGTYIYNNEGNCQKFAVFSGHYCINVPTGSDICCCDHLFEQVPPTAKWGQTFVTVPFDTRAADIFRVLASKDNTIVQVNNNTYNLNQGEYEEFFLSTASYVESNKPILLMQYSVSAEYDNTRSDPFMIVISPLEQVIQPISFNAFTSTVIERYYVNVVIPSNTVNQTFLDGVNVSSSFEVFSQKPEYSIAQIQITQGNHILENPSGMIAYVYGYGEYESYGYIAGANLESLQKTFSFVYDADTIDYLQFSKNVCKNQPFDLIAQVTDDKAIDFAWTLGDGNFANGRNIQHQYINNGSYPVSLSISYEEGCIDVLEAVVNVTDIEVSNEITICSNEQYEIGTDSYSTTGVYTNTFVGQLGCDSIVTTNLIVIPSYEITIDTSICDGTSYEVGNNFYTEAGIFTDNLSTNLGCDSIITSYIRIKEVFEVENIQIFCDVDSYSIGKSTYTTSGVYTDILTSSLNCDSTVTTYLSFESTDFEEIEATICEDEPFQVGNQFYTESGTFTDTLINVHGCDSIVVSYLDLLSCTVAIPSAFSPNEDGINDRFQIFNRDSESTQVVSYQVFNRWGEDIYSAFDFPISETRYWWDGTTDFRPLDIGVYVYLIKVEYGNGIHEIFSGHLALIR
ncbi:MAG: gliding motility-associated C-terminal domain-containing protein, partial [Chitinophagales bacterium]